MKKEKKRIVLTFLIFLELLGLLFFILPLGICLAERQFIFPSGQITDSAGSYEYALVFGCSVRNGVPSDMLKDRLDTALFLYRQGAVRKIAVSGYRENDDYDEADSMKRYLQNAGVPEEDIWADEKGNSTFESVLHFRTVAKEKKCVAVTQRYHLYRAVFLMRKMGIETVGVETFSSYYTGQTKRNMREISALHKDFWKVLFFHSYFTER